MNKIIWWQGSRWSTKAVVEQGNTMAIYRVCQWWRSFARTATSTFSGTLTTPLKLSTRFLAGGRSWVRRPTSLPLTSSSSPCFPSDTTCTCLIFLHCNLLISLLIPDQYQSLVLPNILSRIMLNDHEALVWILFEDTRLNDYLGNHERRKKEMKIQVLP